MNLRLVAPVIAILALITACDPSTIVPNDEPDRLPPITIAPTTTGTRLTVPTPSTTSAPDVSTSVVDTTTTTTTLAPLTVEGPVGALVIPTLGITAAVMEGVSDASLAAGVGHLSGTAYPGEAGNMVIGGSSISNTKVFAQLDRVPTGESITLRFQGQDYTYRVSSVVVTDAGDPWVAAPTAIPSLTLFTSLPSAPDTLVIAVRAELIQ
ncbi:MAG: hypothetical protein CSA55_02630 [Ilumatobacter coccineus]|uniref:Sortase n=1 Tax=Ilumatobacter coccineus TaxID=467094 RepID=A0A2G6KDM2_9ACTN|nr:MAG: hypothetical protein CSA55_02630 [Ilumatobacter coccineus]